MAFNEAQQIKQLIQDSHYILVCFRPGNDLDSAACALAWKNILEKEGKQIDIVSQGFNQYKIIKFLIGSEHIKNELSHLQKFTIKVDISKTKIDSLSYDIKDNWLYIHLNPKQGIISKKELRTAQSSFKYDLIITINSPDLESLGDIFENNTDLFYRLPIINIDHQSGNEHYGAVNVVELNKASSAEITYELFKQINNSLVDANIATALLTGIINKTRSFKTNNITPFTLNVSSELMNRGADREKIVKYLYYNRSVNSLKIWGQALTHLKHDSNLGLVYTAITRDELIRSQASEEELTELIDELILNSPDAKLILLLYEVPDKARQIIKGILVSENGIEPKKLIPQLNPTGIGNRAYFIIEDKGLQTATEEIIGYLRK